VFGEIFWDVVPYVTLAIVVVGSWWRYRYDKFGWTTRSSQLYEARLLRIASPMFHFGILVVIVGHVVGLLIPDSWTRSVGMSEHVYHVQAVVLGTVAGVTTLAGVALLMTTVASFVVPGLSDRIGRRLPMIVLPFVATLVPLGAMYFDGPTAMLGAIFVTGWLVTGTMPLFMATVPAESVDPRFIAGALGVCMGAGELIGGVFAPSLAGFAADMTSLHAPLWIMTALALTAGLVALGIRETAPAIVGLRATNGETI